MPSFKLISGKSFKLDKLGSSKIIIRKIAVVKPDVNPHYYLGIPIKYEIKYPNGKVFSDFIYPIAYFKNYGSSAKLPATNIQMNVVLGFCKHTTLLLENPIAKTTELIELEITYEKSNSITVEIYVTDTIEGYSFEVSPASKQTLVDEFPSATIASRLLVGRETFHDFQTIYGTFNSNILTALTGLDEDEIKKIDYQIVSSATGKVIYSSNKK